MAEKRLFLSEEGLAREDFNDGKSGKLEQPPERPELPQTDRKDLEEVLANDNPETERSAINIKSCQ